MKVEDVMTRDVQCCGPETNLAAAAEMMWDSDCGALPVVDVAGRVVGVVTDRDICLAASTRNRTPSAITVRETASGRAVTCRPGADVRQALALMEQAKVRRLPVTDEDGTLRGMLSLNDLVLAAGEHRGRSAPELSVDEVMKTFKAVCAHRVPAGI